MKNPTTRPSSRSSSARTRPQQGASIARRETAVARRPAPVAAPQVRAVPVEQTFPVSAHRILAAAALLMLLLLALVGPRTAPVPDTSALITPSISGTDSLPGSATAGEVENSLFRYRTIVERSLSNSPSIPDNIADVLHYPPDSMRVRKLLIGQMFASTSGNLDQTLADTGFFANSLSEQFLSDIENSYGSLATDEKRGSRGFNGLAVISMFRSLSATGPQRDALEQSAIAGFQTAISAEPNTWQFTYNWSLANMVLGNYASAYDGMKGLASLAESANNRWPRFWMGLAALRLGDSGIALQTFQTVMNTQVTGGNQAFQDVLARERDLAAEGYADAQWANVDPAGAYDSYYKTMLTTNSDDTGLYDKWLRLGIQQRAYDRLVSDMTNLEGSGSGLAKSPRLHHDRARLLTFLGRNGEAASEYQQALSLDNNEPSLLVSYGQFLESQGDHNGALTQADQAIRGLGKDPVAADLTGVAHSVVLSTTSFTDMYAAQQLLDANLLRAHAWGKSNQTANLDNLVANIAAGAEKAPPVEAGLIQYYAGAAAEAGGAYDKAVSSYSAAWEKLKGQPEGTTARAAALAGLARATARTKDAAAGVQVLATNGYDPASPTQQMTIDADAPDLLYQGALLLQSAGKGADSTNAMRVSAIMRNTQQARLQPGIGRPLWSAGGTIAPVGTLLAAADQARTTPGNDPNVTAFRYKQVAGLDPSVAASWNNLGVTYADAGKPNLAAFYLNWASKVSPGYALGQHNQAASAYRQGIGNFFNAEAAQAGAIKAAGPGVAGEGYNLQADSTSPLPQPTQLSSDMASRLPAILIALLLLAHTIVGNDRLTNRSGLLPTKGGLGMLATPVDAYVRRVFPGLAKPGTSTRALLASILIPSVIGMLGLAMAAGHWSISVALVFLPVALVAALIAFGANVLAQRWVARRNNATTVHHPWPLGLLLGIVSIPFGFAYGWQEISRVRPAKSAEGESIRHGRTEEEQDLAYEAQVEALAEMPPDEAVARTGAPVAAATPSGQLFNLSPAARILAAGLFANLALVVIFGAAYWLLAWPSLRLAMYASALVLAFTAVSEPPAAGWTLYRRNAPLWLAVFAIAATVTVLLAAGIM